MVHTIDTINVQISILNSFFEGGGGGLPNFLKILVSFLYILPYYIR